MRPAVDHEGRIWFGEMGRNYLAYLDPRTQTFHQMTPPHGHNGIMGVLVAPDDSIWFAEQYANYTGGLYGLAITPTGEIWVTITGENIIARLDIAAHNFIYYPIPTPGSLPFGLVMGANHTVWFTEAGTNKIGMLKP